MASRLAFLVCLDLFAAVACFYNPEFKLNVDDRFNKTMESVKDFLWKSFETEIRNESNVLFFTVQSAIDIDFITQVQQDKKLKERFMKSLNLYDTFEVDLTEIDNLTRNDALYFKTIFIGDYDEMGKRKMMDYVSRRVLILPDRPKDRFQLVVTSNKEKFSMKWKRVLAKVTKSGMDATCGVSYCAYPIILGDNAPFAILTMATWKIGSVDGFQMRENVNFYLSPTSELFVFAVRSVEYKDYAEFDYPNLPDCSGRVLRLPYKQHFNMFFVIPYEVVGCNSKEDLWKNVRNINLNQLSYVKKPVYLTVPYFSVAANIDMRMKLMSTVLSQAFDNPSSTLYDALAFQAVEVIFEPENITPKNKSTPSFQRNQLTVFRVQRPFFFALTHRISPTPIFAGLISTPRCTIACRRMILGP